MGKADWGFTGHEFTPREKALIQAILAARTNRAIAVDLGFSEQAVKNSLTRLYKKVGVRSRLELMRIMMKTRT